MISTLLQGSGVSLRDVTQHVMRKMDSREAMRRLKGKLPANVANLVQLSEEGGLGGQKLEENDLERALFILNGMIEKAWKKLDKKIDVCKEFEARNRGTYSQVMADLDRLGSQISDNEGRRDDATNCMSELDDQREETSDIREREFHQYDRTKKENEYELKLRENERAVWNFIMQLTKCSGASTLMQLNHSEAHQHVNQAGMKVCQNTAGFRLVFANADVQSKFDRQITPRVQRMLSEVLGRVQANEQPSMEPISVAQEGEEEPLSFVQEEDEDSDATGDATDSTTTTLPLPQGAMSAPTIQVVEDPLPSAQWKKCTDGTPNCGLLHDTISLEWGGYRDAVDELKDEMAKDEDAWNEKDRNFNEQFRAIRAGKAKCSSQLSNANSNLNMDNIEKKEKEEEARELTKEYKREMRKCRRKIEEILFTFICAIRKTRNELMKQSSKIKQSDIIDCDVSDWVPGECTVPCDNRCPHPTDPYKCGGRHKLTRDIIQAASQYGVKCPTLSTERTCNQKKCPVDCVMSQWSGWSACSKECEGGVKGHTRTLITKAKNGGKACDVPEESSPCNVGSCDRDCELFDWTAWSPCSMACGGGMQTRHKKVNVPTRGNGECPKDDALGLRFEEQKCNSQDCIGDEICIANMDLILAIDGSGSLRQSGFEVVRNFARNLTERYESQYFGQDTMKVGVVQFGNGLVSPSGEITPAIQVNPLTSNLAEVRENIMKMTWQRGFTNMAQALIAADVMLGRGGRSDAQSAVIILSDGKPSLVFQTQEKINELKQKNVQIFMAPILGSEGTELDLMREWASQPWETNLVRIPGLAALKGDAGLFTTTLVSTFCSDSMSPSLMHRQEEELQYILLVESKWPSDSCAKYVYNGRVTGIDECADMARSAGWKGFSLGKGRRKNRCWFEGIKTTQTLWDKWQNDRADPECTDGWWYKSKYYDTYVFNPKAWAENAIR